MPLVPLDFHKSGRYCELPNDKSDVEWELANFVECFGDMVLPVRSDHLLPQLPCRAAALRPE
jgi:hypothetical protein